MLKPLLGISAVVTPLAIVAACISDRVTQPSPSAARRPAPIEAVAMVEDCAGWPGAWYPGTPQNEKEEEVFGEINTSSGTWVASLTARDAATTNNQADYMLWTVPVNLGTSCFSSGPGHANVDAHWGWYAFGTTFGGQCVDLESSANNDPERHRLQGGSFPADYEEHCINAGRFTLTLKKNEDPAFVRPIDFIAYVVTPSFHVEKTTGGLGAGTADVIVDVDESSGSSATPLAEVSAATNPYNPSWTTLAPVSGVYHIPSNFWVRFRTSNSTPSGSVPISRLLVRYFWNWGVSSTDRTGFTNPAALELPLIRATQFTEGTRTVRMQLVQPHERPVDPSDVATTSYGAVTDLAFNIHPALTVDIRPNPASVVVLNALQFADSGSNGGAGPTYDWAFGDGGASTSASPSHTYTTPGQQTVTLDKEDQYGFVATGTRIVNVTDPPPTNLDASSITSSSATVSWAIGNSAASTTVERRPSGTSTWTAGGTAGAGSSTLGLSGLDDCTTYDVRAFHVTAATTAPGLFRTLSSGGTCAPTNFHVTGCFTTMIGGQLYRSYDMQWTQEDFSFHGTYEIVKASSNNPAAGMVVSSGSNHTTTATLGPYKALSTTYYFWVRHTLSGGGSPSAWTALADNPVNPAFAC